MTRGIKGRNEKLQFRLILKGVTVPQQSARHVRMRGVTGGSACGWGGDNVWRSTCLVPGEIPKLQLSMERRIRGPLILVSTAIQEDTGMFPSGLMQTLGHCNSASKLSWYDFFSSPQQSASRSAVLLQPYLIARRSPCFIQHTSLHLAASR